MQDHNTHKDTRLQWWLWEIEFESAQIASMCFSVSVWVNRYRLREEAWQLSLTMDVRVGIENNELAYPISGKWEVLYVDIDSQRRSHGNLLETQRVENEPSVDETKGNASREQQIQRLTQNFILSFAIYYFARWMEFFRKANGSLEKLFASTFNSFLMNHRFSERPMLSLTKMGILREKKTCNCKFAF